MDTNFSINEYTKERDFENVSTEINISEQENFFCECPTNTNLSTFKDMYEIIYDDDKVQYDKVTILTYRLLLEEMKQNNLLYINNKLKYENTLKELIIKNANEKLKLYYEGYRIWKTLLGDKFEDFILIK